MPVWPILMGLSVAVLVVALVARNAPAAKVAGAIFAAYMAGRIIKMGPDEYQLSAFAIVWLVVAVVSVAVSFNRYGISLMLVGVSACYVWAKLTAAPWVFGSPPFVISDLLALAAMLFTGWGVRHEFVGRVAHMVRHSNSRGFSLGADRATIAPKAKAKKAGP